MISITWEYLLFHWQHEINTAYWKSSQDYDHKDACFLGSSFLLVPNSLKWITLGIEYHHIHHLNTKIPSYNLRKCHEEAPQEYWSIVQRVDFNLAFVSCFNTMWNEETQRFDSFDIHKKLLFWLGFKIIY